MKRVSAFGLALVAFGLAACSKTYIPNTDVVDNGENRRVIAFCEDYRHAVEERNVGQIMKMMSPQYHEDGGNIRGEDDLDHEGVKAWLTSTFLQTQSIRYEIRYRRVTFTESMRVLVDFTYAGSYRHPGVKQEEWRHTVSDNRLELVPDGESFKILSGL